MRQGKVTCKEAIESEITYNAQKGMLEKLVSSVKNDAHTYLRRLYATERRDRIQQGVAEVRHFWVPDDMR